MVTHSDASLSCDRRGELLDQRRKAEFWAALGAENPDREYLDELTETDAAFAGDVEQSIARFEAGL